MVFSQVHVSNRQVFEKLACCLVRDSIPAPLTEFGLGPFQAEPYQGFTVRVKAAYYKDAFSDDKLVSPTVLVHMSSGLPTTVTKSMPHIEPPFSEVRTKGIGLRDLLTQLFRERKLIVSIFIAVLLLGLIAGFAKGTIYKAEARLLVLPSREYVINQEVGASASSLSMSSSEFVLSEAEFFKNTVIMQTALDRVGLELVYPKIAERIREARLSQWQMLLTEFNAKFSEEPVETLRSRKLEHQQAVLRDSAILTIESHLKVQTVKDANVIQLGFTHKSPEIAARMLENLIVAYQDFRREVYTQKRSDLFKTQRDRFAERLGDKERELARFKLANHFSEFKDQKSLLVRQRAELTGNRLDAATKLREVEARLDAVRQRIAALPKEVVEYQENITEDSASAARVALTGLEARRNELLTKFTRQSKFVKDLDEQIDALSQTVSTSTPSTSQHRRLARNPVLQDMDAELATRSVELAALRQREGFLTAEQVRIDTQLVNFDRLENTYNTLIIERDLLKENLKTYAQRAEEAMILEEMDRQKMDNIRVIEAPKPPEEGTNLMLIFIVLAVIGGVFAALAAALLKGSVRQVFLTPEDVERHLGLPVLLTIPFKEPRPRQEDAV